MIGQARRHRRGPLRHGPSSPRARNVLTGQQKLYEYIVKYVIASCCRQSFENRYVLRALRALRWRSVAWYRSTNDVLIARLAFDRRNAASTAATVPKMIRQTISTTRPFSRRFSTVA